MKCKAMISIDWEAIQKEVEQKPEIQQLKREIEYLETVNAIFEGKIKKA